MITINTLFAKIILTDSLIVINKISRNSEYIKQNNIQSMKNYVIVLINSLIVVSD